MKPSNPSLRPWLLALSASITLSSAITARAATYDWDGGFATNGSWAQSTNWNPDGVPTFNNQADLKFNDSAMGFFRNFIAVDRTVRSLEFNNTSATALRVILGTQDGANDGGTSRNLTFSADSGNASILMGADSGAAVSIGLNNGSFVGSITLASNLDITNDSSTRVLTIARSMSETGDARQVTKLGVGQLEFRNSTHTFTGGLLIKNGEIFMGQASTNAINAANVVTLGDSVTNTSGSLDMRTMNQEIAGLASVGTGAANRVRSTTGAATLTLSGATGTHSFNGAIQNSISLVKTGGSTQILSGTNIYTGGTTLTGGTLQFAKTLSMSATGAVAVGTGTTLAVSAGGSGEFSNATSGNGSIGGLLAGTGGQGAAVNYTGNVTLGIDTTNAGGSLTYSGVIGDVGTTLGLNKLGSGTLTLSGANTHTGGTSVTGGLLNANHASAIGTGPLNLQGGSVTLSTANNSTVSNPINVTSAGTITVASRATTLGGLITLSADTAFVGTGTDGSFYNQITQTGGITSANNSKITITVNNAGNHVFSGAISLGTGSITRPSGNAALTLSNPANSFSGGLNLAASPAGSFTGLTTITNNGAQGSGDITFTGGTGGIVFSNTAGTVANNILSTGGSGGVTKAGASNLTLSGTNTYTGATSVSGGRLAIGSTGTINSTSGISIGAGEFNYNNSTTALTQPVTFSGSTGTLSGTGTLTPAVIITTGNRQTAGTSVTAANSSATLGKQTFTTGITYNAGSIFEWNLTGNTESSVGTRGTDFDAVTTASLGGTGGAIFRVILNGTQNFGESFWDSDRTWAGIFKNFGETTAYDLSTVFSGGFQYQNSTETLSGVTTTEGAFTFINGGADLQWTAVPEPTSALAGLLIGAGLLRRRRA